jgi:AcrR family transcriptional regulator
MTSQQSAPRARSRRADTLRTERAIVAAAEKVLRRDPTATMEEIAEAAGVSRTTVHRRFSSRDALIDALVSWAAEQFSEAVAAARVETTPPLVALYQVTVNVLRVKIGWSYAMERASTAGPEVARIHAEVLDKCRLLFRRAQAAGVIRDDVDLGWVQRAYYALVHEATQSEIEDDEDVDTLATQVVDTLLQGVGGQQGLS